MRGRFLDSVSVRGTLIFFSPIVKLTDVLIGTSILIVFINVKSSSGPKLSSLSYGFAIEELKLAAES